MRTCERTEGTGSNIYLFLKSEAHFSENDQSGRESRKTMLCFFFNFEMIKVD